MMRSKEEGSRRNREQERRDWEVGEEARKGRGAENERQAVLSKATATELWCWDLHLTSNPELYLLCPGRDRVAFIHHLE